MASFPSIQSFYQKEVPSSSPALAATGEAIQQPSDTITGEDDTADRLPTVQWDPRQDYEELPISQLQSGPGAVKFQGRIVNYCTARDIATRRPYLPQGNHFLVVKDDTGVIAVKLLAQDSSDDSRIRLGTLVTVWTTFVADFGASAAVHIPFVSQITSIHLAEHSPSCLKFHDESLDPNEIDPCRTPLQYSSSPGEDVCLPGLMSLKAYLLSGNEGVASPRILVCVKSIGPRKTVKPAKLEVPSQLVDVGVFDETDSCVLKVWGEKVESTKGWKPNATLLLLTNPTYHPSNRKDTKADIGIGLATMVDVDPAFPDAHWLRQTASNATKKESICIPFPEGTWEVEKAVNGSQAALFTIAEIDDFVREDPSASFTGKLSLIILGMNMMENSRKGKLCCTECCGIPLYSNNPTATCKNCLTVRDLPLNPSTIGTMADETGCITTGKLVWSDQALAHLFFGEVKKQESAARQDMDNQCCDDDFGIPEDVQPWETLTVLDKDALRLTEEQLLYARLTLTFGWCHKIGRLCVLWVEW